MNTAILTRLLFAHILSDFFLQTESLCRGKYKGGKKQILYLLVHSVIHAAVAYLFVGLWNNWIIPLIIFITHFVIDWIKTSRKEDNAKVFIIDQMAHLVVIFLLWNFMADTFPLCQLWNNFDWDNTKIWAILIGYALMLKPSSVLLNLLLNKWGSVTNNKSLPKAGEWIGYLERILILTFVLTNNVEGVGFLLAAKSVFRFGELKKSDDVKTTEYILLGTFSSFTIAILTGFILLS